MRVQEWVQTTVFAMVIEFAAMTTATGARANRTLPCRTKFQFWAQKSSVDNAPPFPGSLDGHPLKIKELRGEEPIESIELSQKGLGVASAVVIAILISSNKVTKSLMSAA